MKLAGILFPVLLLSFPAIADETDLEPYYPGHEFRATDGPILIEDGDSFWIGIHRVRLMGIDTLEPNQPCEADGKSVDCHGLTMQFVESLFNDPSLVCKLHMAKNGRPLMDSGRYISTCFVDGKEINRLLVSEGFAVAYTPKTGPVYESAEQTARARRKGLFKYRFEDPIDYRRRGNTASCPAD